jgi:uncharacterized protein DUF5719
MKSRRFFFIVALVVLVVAGLAIGNGSDAAPKQAAVPAAGTNAAALASSNTVWFCPGAPAKAYPASAGRVTLSNIGDTAAEVEVTDLADNGKPTHAHFGVPARSVVTRTRDAFGGPGALTIETFGGRVLVEEGTAAAKAFESTTCATRTSPHWYFAAGSTPRGVQQWLVITNPYASDAKVDVTMRTSSGVRKPEELQSMDVSRRSRTVVAVHDYAVRQDRVAVEVDAEIGSVVASQISVFTSDAGSPGVAQTIGSPAPASEWILPGGLARPGATTYVAIANVGNDTAQVDVQPTDERRKATLSPVILTVPQDAVVWVSLGKCSGPAAKSCVTIPDNTQYVLDVRAEQNMSIVAQTFSRFDLATGGFGTTTALGAITPARSYAFGRAAPPGSVSTTISVFNPGAIAAAVDLSTTSGGTVDHAGLQHVVIAPGGQQTLTLPLGTRRRAVPDAAVTLTSSQPVFVERTIVVADEASMAAGVVGG